MNRFSKLNEGGSSNNENNSTRYNDYSKVISDYISKELVIAKAPEIPEKFTDPEKFGSNYKTTKELAIFVIKQFGIEPWMHDLAGISDLCPDYSSRDQNGKNEFWAILLTAIVAYESEYNPKLVFFEGDYDNRSSMQKDSVGLMQLSFDDSKGPYGKLQGWLIESEDDLKNPYKNLASAFSIVKYWLKKDGTLGEGTRQGLGRYWSAFRDKEKASTKYGKYDKVRGTVRANLGIDE